MAGLVHKLVATLPDEPGAEVNKAEWNDDHGSGVAASGTVLTADGSGNADFLPPTIPISGAVTGGTNGSVLFIGSGALAQDNANFFWDDTNDRLGIGTASPLARQHLVVNSIGASPALASGLLLDNQTAATAVLQQYAPAVYLRGRGWKTTATAASQTVDLRIQNVPILGTTAPTGQMQFGYSINGGAFVNAMTVSSLGVLAVTGSFTCNGSMYNGATSLTSNIYINSASTATQTNGSGYYFGTSGNISFRTGFNGTTNYTIPANNIYGALIIGSMPVIEASTGTHPVISNLIVRTFAITNAGGATADAATVYIEAAPTGVTPTGGLYGLIVDSGNVRIDDRMSVGTGTTPSGALIHVGAGSAQLASMNFNSGTLKTTNARGDLEYDGDLWYWSHSDVVRRANATWLVNPDSSPALSSTPVPTDYYGTDGTKMLGTPDYWIETVISDAGSAVVTKVPHYLPAG